MMPRNAQFMPQLKHLIANNNNSAFVEVYSFAGYQSPQQALAAYQQYISGFGGYLQYQQAGVTIPGYEIYNGQTTAGGQVINWMAALKTTGNGVVGISSGANSATGNQYQSTVLNIINSLQ